MDEAFEGPVDPSLPSCPPIAAAMASREARISLEPQRQLPQESCLSSSSPGQKVLGPASSFLERQEALLAKQGRANATRGSRSCAAVADEDPDLPNDQKSILGSIASRASRAPSYHPSVGQSSAGLSETTIGAGDDTAYWDFQHRKIERRDLGHRCHECKKPFQQLGAALSERRGARTSYRYHGECFSGFADPRSQARSSHFEGRLAGTQMEAAPAQATSKMRTTKHFELGGRVAPSVGGKFGALMSMGHNSFGNKSSKGKMHIPQRAPGGFTEEQLAAHNDELKLISE